MLLRRKVQRIACAANTLAYVLVFGVVIIHVLHRRDAANVGPGDDQDVVFWFEAGDDGDDQPPYHRPFSVNPRVVLGALGTFCIAALCDAGSLRGASTILGLFAPLYCLVVGFGLKEAAGLAQAAIAGASLTSLAFNLFRSHPWDPSKTLVDIDLALILTPTSLLGVSVGVLLNDLLPNWLITVMLVGLLAYVCRRKAMLGLNAMHEEVQQEAARQAAMAIGSGPVPHLRPICTASSSMDSNIEEEGQQQQQQAAVVVLSAAAEAAGVFAGGSQLASGSGAAQQGDLSAPAAAAAVPSSAADSLSDSSDLGSSRFAGPFFDSAQVQMQQQEDAGLESLPVAESPPLQQQKQQQQRKRNPFFADDSSESLDDLQAPLLDVSEGCEAAAAAAAAGMSSSRPGGDSPGHSGGGGSSRSRSGGIRQPLSPAVPFMASVALPPLPPSLPAPPSLPTAAATAAAAGSGTLAPPGSAVFAGQVIRFSVFPWIKFFSMVMLCLGFFGLNVLEALIPLCSWYFVTYMTLFLLLTVLVTYVFVKVILMDPLMRFEADSKQYSSMETGEAAADAAGADSSSKRSSSSPGRPSLRERFVTWLNVISGTRLAVPRRAQAAAAADGEEETADGQAGADHRLPSRITMSLFRREQLKQQLQLQQPFLQSHQSFTNIGAAAAAAAEAAKAAAEAQDILQEVGQAGPDSRTLVPPQPSSLVHVAAAGAAVAGAAGVVSGVCGLAGAALLTPILLDFRVHPQVATATSILLVCMSSTAAVLSFFMSGRLNGSYALLFAAVSMLGVCSGVCIIGGCVRRRVRESVLVLLLAALAGVAAVVMFLYGAQQVAVGLTEAEGLGFRAVCSFS